MREWEMSHWDKMTNQLEVAVNSWTFAGDVTKAFYDDVLFSVIKLNKLKSVKSQADDKVCLLRMRFILNKK